MYGMFVHVSCVCLHLVLKFMVCLCMWFVLVRIAGTNACHVGVRVFCLLCIDGIRHVDVYVLCVCGHLGPKCMMCWCV